MKIVILSHKFSPDIGGIETVSRMLAEEFVKSGHEVHVITHSSATAVDDFSFVIYREPTLKILFRQYHWADVVLENNPCMRLAWPLIFIPRPKVTALHTWIANQDGSIGITNQIKKKYLKLSNKVTACSDSIRLKTFPKATVTGNAYEDDLFKIKEEIVRDKHFVFLGRLVSDKGADLAIKALAIIKNSNRGSYSLSIIGRGQEKTKLKELVEELGLENEVAFLGSMQGEELVSELNRHEFLIVPSTWEEPFGIVVLEGMACGCLPIVSDGGGLPDAVGQAGLMFKRGQVDDLAIKMMQIVENSALAEQIRGKVPKHLALHSSKIVAKKYLDLIEESLKN